MVIKKPKDARDRFVYTLAGNVSYGTYEKIITKARVENKTISTVIRELLEKAVNENGK